MFATYQTKALWSTFLVDQLIRRHLLNFPEFGDIIRESRRMIQSGALYHARRTLYQMVVGT